MNETSVSVSRAFFTGTISSPGRAVPWVNSDFNYSIPGGMEPGESKDLKLSPNMFGDWGTVDVPANAVLTVVVKRLDGPDKKPAFDAEAFSEHDADRLKALEQAFAK